MRPSLRLRVALAGAASIGAFALLLAWFSSERVRHHALRQTDRALRTEAVELAGNYRSRSTGPGFDRDMARQHIEEEAGHVVIAILGADRRVLAASPGVPDGGLPFDSSDAVLSDGIRVRTLTLDVGEGLPFRYVQTAQSRTHLDRLVTSHATDLAMAVLLAVVLGSVLSWFLAGRVLAPLTAIAHAAEAIGPGRLAVRVPNPGTGDEVDRIAVVLNDMLDRIEAAFRRLEAFTADASHEVRTPLTVLRGEIETALARGDPESMRETMESALTEVERLGHLADGLLALARTDAKVAPLGEIDLREVLADVLDDASALAEARGIAISTPQGPRIVVRGDPTLLRQAAWNAVENAVKYTPTGGRVEVRLAVAGNEALIEVEDTGPGIPPEDRERVFEPFYRVPGRGGEGFGIGLALVRRIAASHGGSASAACAPEGGTTLIVRIPLVRLL